MGDKDKKDYLNKLRKRYANKPNPRLAERIKRLTKEFEKSDNPRLLKVIKGGKKVLLPLALIGSKSADAAILPSGDIATDKAIEDPSSKEFKQRRKTLLKTFRGE